MDWAKKGFCYVTRVNPEIFSESGNEEAAKACCQRCIVAKQCLDHAIANNEEGVWGGTTTEERRAAKRGGERKTCPGCSGTKIFNDGYTEICLSCGLSWLI